MLTLKDIINSLCTIKKGNTVYFHAMDLYHRLKAVSHLDAIDDVIMGPFYLPPNATYEMYEYELDIVNMEQSDRIDFYLQRTGANSLEDILPEVLRRMEHSYIEVIKGDTKEALAALLKYLEFLFEDAEVKNRIPRDLMPFDQNNLYFEVFFMSIYD